MKRGGEDAFFISNFNGDDITVIEDQVVTSPSSGILDEVPKTKEVQGTESIGILDEVQRTEKIGGTESIGVLNVAQVTEGLRGLEDVRLAQKSYVNLYPAKGLSPFLLRTTELNHERETLHLVFPL